MCNVGDSYKSLIREESFDSSSSRVPKSALIISIFLSASIASIAPVVPGTSDML